MDLLKNRPDEFVSGEMICQTLGVSRTAIWKHIKELQEKGYGIEATRNKGYRIQHVPDLVTPEEILPGLQTRRLGQHVVYLDHVDSTNTLAGKMADEGALEGTLVIAETQTGGRGRRGRPWFSPTGSGIWMSLVLRPNIPVMYAPQLTLVAAVAISEAFRALTGTDAGIKWPNDILFNGKKCCGILTEMSAEWDQVQHIILGIGINVNQQSSDFPKELQSIATSLSEVSVRPLRRSDIVREILSRFELLYDRYVAEGGFTSVRDAWKAQSITIGRTITALTAKGELTGRAVDIDKNGALLLELPDGQIETIHSADILFS